MIEGGDGLCLALEAFEALGIAGKDIRKNLQGDFTTELRVPGAVDLAHAAHADQRDDFVRPQATARNQLARNIHQSLVG
jgi:hypothetical protein